MAAASSPRQPHPTPPACSSALAWRLERVRTVQGLRVPKGWHLQDSRQVRLSYSDVEQPRELDGVVLSGFCFPWFSLHLFRKITGIKCMFSKYVFVIWPSILFYPKALTGKDHQGQRNVSSFKSAVKAWEGLKSRTGPYWQCPCSRVMVVFALHLQTSECVHLVGRSYIYASAAAEKNTKVNVTLKLVNTASS